VSLEDAGFCKKGEIGPFFDAVDTTYKGSFPVNTDGGQISAGQPVGGAGERQVAKHALGFVNG
jgi:acetyl-CoA acetyltransferase